MKKLILAVAASSLMLSVSSANAESIEEQAADTNDSSISQLEPKFEIKFQPKGLDIEFNPVLDETGNIQKFKVQQNKSAASVSSDDIASINF